MALPGLVLVHGGAHAGDCWDLTIDEIHRLEPDLDVLAVDLPGRRGKPGDLRTVTIADWVDSVVADIEDTGFDDVVLVAHSLGGVSVPGVTTKLGASRVREMVFASAFIPPDGTAVVDTLSGPVSWYARRGARTGKVGELPSVVGRLVFLNGVPRRPRQFMVDRLCSVKSQRRSIAALGGVQTVIPMDTCHDMMVSEPTWLAEVLIERCRRYA